jgi:hypothetical protein
MERIAEIHREAKAAQKRAWIPLAVVFGVAPFIAAAIYLPQLKKKKAEAEAAEKLPDDAALQRYSFSASPQEVTKIFGAGAKPGAIIKLKQPGVFKEVVIGTGAGPTHSIDLRGGSGFDGKRALRRLSELDTGQLKDAPATPGLSEISVDKTLLRIDTRKAGNTGRIEVMTWLKGEKATAAADAFLAAVWWAALDGPQLTPEQLRFLKGTPLSDAARLDVTVPVEDATKTFLAAFPSGSCKTATDMVSKLTELRCTADVGDPMISSVRYTWMSAANAHVRTATLMRRTPPKGDPISCLTASLGAGKKDVVDFASGQTAMTWPLGKRGDKIVVDDLTISFVPRDGAEPKEPTDWAKEHAKIIAALGRCAE